jgi:type II secretory pathway pseudopilin PulG
MVNFVGVRQRARDAQRKSDLRQIQSALELYRADNNSYPASGNQDGQFPTTCPTKFDSTDKTVTYMTTVPCDALGGSYTYSTTNVGANYAITACLENANDNQKDTTNVPPCNGTTNFSYTVVNP